MIQARIANINFRGEFADKPFFERRFSQYTVDGFDNPDMSVCVKHDVISQMPKGEMLTQYKSIRLFKTCEHEKTLAFSTPNKDIYMIRRFTDDYSRVDISINPDVAHPVFSLTDREYMAVTDSLSLRAACMGGCMLHASSLRINNCGIAFSAISGTGKSTQTGLWQQYFGDRVTMINDDRPAIFYDDDTAMIYGTPFSGKTDINNNISAPLRAIIFLTQASECSIKRLDTATAYHQLANQIWRPIYDQNVSVMMLDILERLIKTVPIYMLYCDISNTAVETVYNEIFGGWEI